MNKRHIGALGAIAGATLLAALFILRPAAAPTAAGAEHDDHQPGSAKSVMQSAAQAGTIVLSDQQILANGIEIARSGPRSIASSLQLSGEIHVNGERTAQLSARAAGVVETVAVGLGQQVRRGQTLALVSSTQVAGLRGELQLAQQRLALARTGAAREKTLWEEKISAEQDYLAARQTQQEAQIAVEKLRQNLASLGAVNGSTNRAHYAVLAPFDGTIIERQVARGETVSVDKAMFTIADLSTVWLDLAVPVAALGQVREGANATVSMAGSPAVNATVAWVSAVASEASRSATARIVLPNPRGSWRPGLFASADIGAQERSVPVAVRAAALHQVDGKDVVFARVAGGFMPRPVTRGMSDGSFTELVSGLDAGVAHAAAGSNLVKAEHDKADAGDEH